MTRAVLFRFHKNAEVCEERISLLKKLNPEVLVYGLGEEIEGVEKLKQAGMEHLHVIEDRDSDWKWRNGDLAVKNWFREKGRHEDFDMLHIVEWDLLLTEPLEEIYSDIGEGEIGLSGLKPLHEARKSGWHWVTGDFEEEWKELKNWVEKETGFSEESHGCILTGACLPREFLEEFSEMDVPDLCNDEVRVPLIAEALGFKLKRTGFYPEWGNSEIKKCFNAKSQEIEESRIRRELEDPEGRRVFHPVREKIGEEKIEEWKN